MACEICNPADTEESAEETNDDKPCGHKHACDCAEPERPTGLPPCDGAEPEPDDCDPSGEIADRERQLAALQADIANKNEALEELKAKAELLDEARSAYGEQAETREERRKACQEFVDCKKPDIPGPDCDCVEKAIADYHEAIRAYEDYLKHCIWKVGRARIRTDRAEYRHHRAEQHYEWVRGQATDCLAKCADLRAKYDEAVEQEDWCLAYLYWSLADKMLRAASGDCLDEEAYNDHLCRAFEHLCKAIDKLNAARAAQDDLERDKEAVLAEYQSLRENKLAVLTEQVSKCCCQPESDAQDDSAQTGPSDQTGD